MIQRTVVGPKGRTVLPVASRRQAGVEEGQELIVLEAARGRITLATREAVEAEVWAASGAGGGSTDAAEEIRHMRVQDNALAGRTPARAAAGDDGPNEVGAALLRSLGLQS